MQEIFSSFKLCGINGPEKGKKLCISPRAVRPPVHGWGWGRQLAGPRQPASCRRDGGLGTNPLNPSFISSPDQGIACLLSCLFFRTNS